MMNASSVILSRDGAHYLPRHRLHSIHVDISIRTLIIIITVIIIIIIIVTKRTVFSQLCSTEDKVVS